MPDEAAEREILELVGRGSGRRPARIAEEVLTLGKPQAKGIKA
jgi:hypothetical protein